MVSNVNSAAAAKKIQEAERKLGRKLTKTEIAAILNPPKKETGKGTSVKQTTALKPNALAQKFKASSEKYWGAVNTEEFQGLLRQVNKDNVIAVIQEYSKISEDESLMEMICDEKSNSGKDRKAAIMDIFNKLIAKAEEAGVDVAHFKKAFIDDLNHQFDKWGATSTEKMDEITQSVIQATENKQQLSDEDRAEIAQTPASQHHHAADKALANRINSAQKSFNAQLKQDGWAGDVADFVGKLYGSKNTANNIRKDLRLAKNQFAQLEAAKKQGSAAYEAKFQEIFGTKFDAQNIRVYEKKEAVYAEASAHHGIEEYYNDQAKYFLTHKGLSDEYSNMPGTVPTTYRNATKEQVYAREVAKLANFLGEDGQKVLTDALKEAGLERADIDKKFEFIQIKANQIAAQLHANTLNAGGGKDFSQVQHEYENSYKAAFGMKNDIMKRVTEYNISQQAGAGAVKAVVVVGASLAAAFTGGTSLAAVAGVTAGATVATEVSDKFTSGEVMDTLKADGFIAAIKKGNENTNYTEIFKQAVVSGGMVLVGGGVAKGVQFAAKGLTTVQQAAAMFGADVVTGMAAEKLMTGEITVGGTVFNVLLSGAGNIIAVKMAAKAAQGGKAGQPAAPKSETALQTKANIAEQEAAKITELSTSLESKYGIKIKSFKTREIEISQYGHTRDIVDIEFTCNGKNYTCSYRTNNNFQALEALEQTMGGQKTGIQASKINPTRETILGEASGVKPKAMAPRTIDRTNIAEVRTAKPEELLRPTKADNIAGQGISFKQAPDQPVYNCTRVEWGKTVEETIALNRKNGINIELVKDSDGSYYMGIKDIWTEGGYHRIDRNSAVMQYGKYPKTDDYVDKAWAAKNADADGNIMDCAVIANDRGAQILENSYVTETGQKIDFGTMQAGTPVRKDPNATVNAVAYDSPQQLTTLEGKITTDITMGDVDGNVYNNFKQLKKQITKGQLVPNEADPNSARFIELVKAGDDNAAIALLKQATGAKAPTKTHGPSEMLPKVITDEVNRNLTNVERANLWRYGNATPEEVPAQIRGNVTEYLENMLGKPLKPENLIAGRTDNGTYLSYFDEATNLTTTFTFDGKPNGQWLVNFDAAGKPIDVELYSIYHEGKFWLK